MISRTRSLTWWLVCILSPIIVVSSCADFDRGDALPTSADSPDDDDDANGGDDDGGDDGGDGTTPLSYAADIHAMLVSDCADCHSSAGQASGTELLFEDNPDVDYTEVLVFVDESNPDDSRLLTKASGQGHGGGANYPDTSSEYQLTLEWIEGGALP
ncbi:MAG: hypothetical protein AAF735_05365 [Myxococcota bacterium]